MPFAKRTKYCSFIGTVTFDVSGPSEFLLRCVNNFSLSLCSARRGAVVFFPTRPPRSWGGLTLGDRPMIAINNCSGESKTCWQDGFVDILPEIQQRLRSAFRHLDA